MRKGSRRERERWGGGGGEFSEDRKKFKNRVEYVDRRKSLHIAHC